MRYQKQFFRSLFFVFLLICLLTGLAGIVRVPVNAAPRQAIALDVVINEIAWGGTAASATDEWIELYNPGTNPIDLSGWQLISTTDGSPNITLAGNIPAGGFFLLERTDDTTVLDIVADQIYTTDLSNTGETLELRDSTLPTPNVIDTANGNGGAWSGGDNTTKATMERIDALVADSDTNWASNDGVTVNGLDNSMPTPLPLSGTPKQINSVTLALTQTPTSTSSSTPTNTPTATSTPTDTAAPVVGVVISEFRTTGPGGGNDEFIELYNPTGSPILIGGWTVNRSTGCGTSIATMATIPATTTLASGQHYLIGGLTYSGIVDSDLSSSLNIANNGGIALLNGTTIVDQVGLCATTLYLEGTTLTPLTTNTDQSYDRKSSVSGICVDSNNNATDFFQRIPSDPQNQFSSLTFCGNPTITPTVTRTPTITRTPTVSRTPTKTRTPTVPPTIGPPPLVAINEFVPRPGRDWNNDGVVNTNDEYIEIINHGVVNVNLSGYSLDDEANIGSSPYRLPSVTIKPGERIPFYGSETGLLLSDGGDGVRLLKSNGQLVDAYNYFVVDRPDQSYCRLPDNGGLDDWNQNCYPTPGLTNALRGNFIDSPVQSDDEPLCPIADTLPQDFAIAECSPFGNNIWSRYYWDRFGWYGERVLPNMNGKWDVFVD